MSAATRVLVAVAALSLAAGLATAAGAATTTRYAIPGAGATIAVPSSWKALERRTVTNSAAFRRFIDQNPALRPFVAQMTGATSPIKLMAFDLTLSGTFATNVNVVLAGPSPSLTPSQVATAYGRELKSQLRTVVGPVATSVVTLPSGSTVRASYRVRFAHEGRSFIVQTLQYVVLRRDKSLVVTFSTMPAEAARRNGTFTAMARSLRFGS